MKLRRDQMLGSLAMLALVSACSSEQGAMTEAAGQQVQSIPVRTMPVTFQDQPNTIELPGRVRASAEAEIRPQVTGIIEARLFTEGDYVEAGQALYQIDDAEYVAAVQSARAALARAQATAENARETANRFERLSGINAVSRQEYDQAAAAAKQAEADIAIQQAALSQAQIDLARTTIKAPIDGRIGRSSVTQGALVTQNQTNALARIVQIDPVYVDLAVSSSRLLGWRLQSAEGRIADSDQDKAIEVDILLENGATYTHKGRLEFSETNVDETAGTVAVRVVVPNPEGILLPGMFVRAQFDAGVYEDVALLPQSVVSRTPTGAATVLVVGPDGTAQQRQLQVEQQHESNWIIRAGLEPSDNIIVSNLQNVRPGTRVSVVMEQGQTDSVPASRGGVQ